MEHARTPRAAMRLSMLPLAAAAFAATPAAASDGGSASPAVFALALTPAAVLTTHAKASPSTQANKAIKAGMRLGALPCAATVPSFATPQAATSKASFILKGAPSKLEQMKLAQAGIAVTAPAPASTLTFAVVQPGPAYPASQMPTAALVAMPMPRACPSALSAIKSALRTPDAPGAVPQALTASLPVDPTTEFGSRPLRVNHTRFDDSWARVTRDPQRGVVGAQLRAAGISAAAGEADLFKAVNNWVNRQIGYASDDSNYHRADYWATAAETIARGRGDCEDFAILKMQMLRGAGFDADRMKLVLLRDLVGGGDHAVLLVVDKNGQRLVMDNTTDQIYDGSRGDYFRPVFSYGTGGRFVHGFDTRAMLAAAAPAPTSVPASTRTPVRLAMLNQRSVSADPLTFKTGLSK